MPNRAVVSAALLLLGLAKTTPAALSVKAIAAGGDRSLALTSDGTVWEWGARLPSLPDGVGLGDAAGRAAPTRVKGLGGVVAVASGIDHNLALKEDGTVWAWGHNDGSQLGDGTTTDRPDPVQVVGLNGVAAISAGWSSSVALKGDGTVWTWGNNLWFKPTQVSGLTGVIAVAAGSSYGLALKGDGTVWVWGDYNYSGRWSAPVQVGGLGQVVAIAAGSAHNLALKGDGTVWAWGGNYYGQLGDGTNSDRWIPAQVSNLTGVRGVAAGKEGLSLAVKGDGTVWAWGNNDCGQLGDGSNINRTTPVEVGGLSGIAAVAAGYGHSLALKDDGTLWAWGHNNSRQLGDGTTAQRATPLEVHGLSGVVAVAAGQTHSVALKSDGTVWVWGGNEAGELWFGATTGPAVPSRVDGLSGIVAVAAGDRHNLALKDDKTVWAWGSNRAGQLGDGTTTDRSTPVRVSGLDTAIAGVVAIAAGGSQSLALKADGTVWEWGQNADSGFANAPWVGRTAAERLGGLAGVVAIAAGNAHGLALRQDGTVWAWGGNWAGQLGGGTDAMSSAPVQVSGLAGVVAIGAGRVSSLAATGDGKVWAWGSEYWALVKPRQVSGLSGFLAAGVGGYNSAFSFPDHALALKADGTVWAWGDNLNGELGDGTSTYYRSTPVQVCGLSEVASIAAGGAHSLAVKRDGTVWAWGASYQGQLGTEPAASRLTPVPVIQPGSPDLEIAMSHDGDFTVSGSGLYRLTITNAGLTGTTGLVTVTDMLPPGLTYMSASGDGWACWATDQLVTCTNAGPVEPGTSSTITVTVNVDWAAWPGVTNLAAVSNASDRNVANNASGDPTVVLPAVVVVNAVVNAATFRTGPIAPGELVTIFGKEMGPAGGVSQDALWRTRVLFDGVAVPVLFARADQVTAVAPYALAGQRSAEVQVEYRGVKSSPLTLAVAESAPGVFTANAAGSGQGAILNEDGSLNSASKPARRGSLVTLFATGEGQTALPITVLIGSQQAPFCDAGNASGLPGVLQVRAWVPGPIAPGPAVPVTLVVGGVQSQTGVTLAVQ